jgi:hypothetical protein
MRATTRTGRAGAHRPSRLPCSARYRHATGNGHAGGRAVHAAVQLSLSALPRLAQRLRAAASEATRTNALLASPAGYSAACSPCAREPRATAFARLASVSATERQTLPQDDQQARRVRLLLLSKAAVLAHRFERPLAAELDDQEQRGARPQLRDRAIATRRGCRVSLVGWPIERRSSSARAARRPGGPAAQRPGVVRAPQAVASVWRWSFRRLWVAVISRHSALTAARPLR